MTDEPEDKAQEEEKETPDSGTYDLELEDGAPSKQAAGPAEASQEQADQEPSDAPPETPDDEKPRWQEEIGDALPDVEEGKRLLHGLLDFSFQNLITPKIITILYSIAILFAGLQALGLIMTCLAGHFGWLGGIAGIITAPIVFAVSVVLARVSLEMITVFFRIAKNTDKLLEQKRK